ncbi:MAG: hypothetical protein JSV86_13070 [Gemmatimonadota bacterium]|nr:MAG: hypothetical protein JSV86_13070 [Gemmatimonadota bacterium]
MPDHLDEMKATADRHGWLFYPGEDMPGGNLPMLCPVGLPVSWGVELDEDAPDPGHRFVWHVRDEKGEERVHGAAWDLGPAIRAARAHAARLAALLDPPAAYETEDDIPF